MPRLTAEERDEQLETVRRMIDQGHIRNWSELARVLGVSRQAAQARFGPEGYGLEMPKNPGETVDNRIYLGLTDDLYSRLKAHTGSNGQQFIRQLLDQHLPKAN